MVLMNFLSNCSQPLNLISLTDRLLGASPLQATLNDCHNDNLLNAFGLTNNLQGQVKHLYADPANVPVEWVPATFSSSRKAYISPLQPDCCTASAD